MGTVDSMIINSFVFAQTNLMLKHVIMVFISQFIHSKICSVFSSVLANVNDATISQFLFFVHFSIDLLEAVGIS